MDVARGRRKCTRPFDYLYALAEPHKQGNIGDFVYPFPQNECTEAGSGSRSEHGQVSTNFPVLKLLASQQTIIFFAKAQEPSHSDSMLHS